MTGPLSADFVPLNTLGGVSAGSNTFADDWLPWVSQQATNPAGTTYALGAEIGPIATCYRTDLLAEAGLPTRPAVLARDWATWPGYLKLGKLFKTRIPHGPAFTDSVTSLYDVAGQAKERYYSQSGQLVVNSNPAIKDAWSTAVQAAQEGLSAKLAPLSAAWDRGLTRESFATVMCPAWMLSTISRLAGPLGSGKWNVTTAPGGAGNSGGFYLALPKRASTSRRRSSWRLVTGETAGIALFRTQGDFPANFAAVTAINTATNGYFSGARVGKIFGDSADQTPATILGPASDVIGGDVDSDLSQVEVGQMGSDRGWQAALRQATGAASQATAH